MPDDPFNISLNDATAGSGVSNNCKKKASWTCPTPIKLVCEHHGEAITTRCGRWRTCAACSLWKQMTLRQRLIAGVERCPEGDKLAMFVTLTFPASCAPDEDMAHNALRSLVARLRYRDYLAEYSWVLQRQRGGAGTLHYHGIWWMRPWPRSDRLREWRSLIVASGFGVQNKLVIAQSRHAGYCANYISRRMATLAPLRRAYGFSRGFPLSEYERQRRLLATQLPSLREQFGIEPECSWLPEWELRA
jgi:hypothetical protein